MCVPSGIDYEPIHNRAKPMDFFDQIAFVIGLETDDFNTPGKSLRNQQMVDIRQRGLAVDLRLALAQEIQIRAV